MIGSFLINDLLYGDLNFPNGISSDKAILSWFAKENDVTIEELKDSLEKYMAKYGGENGSNRDKVRIRVWRNTAKEILKEKKMLVKNGRALDTVLTDTAGNHDYGAYIKKGDGQLSRSDKYVVVIIRKRTDDEFGNMTGFPNEEYWDGTPASYYASSFLGYDDDGEHHRDDYDVITIDGGQNWKISGGRALRKEIEAKYGDEIRKEFVPTARKVYETLKRKRV